MSAVMSYESYGYDSNVARRQRSSSAVLPGDALTEEVLADYREKQKFILLIDMFTRRDYFDRDDARISVTTAEASKAFFTMLIKKITKLPKIAPDGEGGLLSVWEKEGHTAMLVIDGWNLHLVTKAMTPNASYFDDIKFNEDEIPTEIYDGILEAL